MLRGVSGLTAPVAGATELIALEVNGAHRTTAPATSHASIRRLVAFRFASPFS